MNKLLTIIFYTAIITGIITVLIFLVLMYILIWWDVTHVNEILMTLFLTFVICFLTVIGTGEYLNRL